MIHSVKKQGKIRLEKIKAIKEYSKLQSTIELKSFLRLTNYMRNFILKYAEASVPLYRMIKGKGNNSFKNIEWAQKNSINFNK